MATTAAPVEQPRSTRDASMGAVRAVMLMTRPSQLALIALLFVNGVLLAAWHGMPMAPASLGLALLLLLAAAGAVHLANEAADVATDRMATRTPFSGGSGALEASRLDARVPMRLGLLLAVAATVGATLALVGGAMSRAAFVLLVLGLIGGLAYSLPPVAAMRRGLGEPLNAVLGGLALPLYGVAAASAVLGWLDVLAFLPFTFVVFASVLATAWPDREADAATGKRTLQVRLSPTTLRRLAWLTAGLFLAATVASAATGAMPFAGAGLLVVPLLAVGLRRYTRNEDPVANVAAMVGLAGITFTSLGFAVWAS